MGGREPGDDRRNPLQINEFRHLKTTTAVEHVVRATPRLTVLAEKVWWVSRKSQRNPRIHEELRVASDADSPDANSGPLTPGPSRMREKGGMSLDHPI
jgi:hypothetical protein